MKKLLLITLATLAVIIFNFENNPEQSKATKPLVKQDESVTLVAPVQIEEKTEAIREEVKKSTPSFELPKNLQGKAVLTKEDRAQLYEYYSDVKTIMNAYMELNRFDNIALDKTYEPRLRAMHYLITGAMLNDNPERENIAQYLFHYVIKDHFESLSDLNKRKLVFADKVEIIALFKKNYPELYTQLKKNYEGAHLNKLIAYVERK